MVRFTLVVLSRGGEVGSGGQGREETLAGGAHVPRAGLWTGSVGCAQESGAWGRRVLSGAPHAACGAAGRRWCHVHRVAGRGSGGQIGRVGGWFPQWRVGWVSEPPPAVCWWLGARAQW